MSLHQLGADAGILSEFEIYAASGSILGRVAASNRDEYRVLTDDVPYRAEPTGNLVYSARSRAELPAVGDWVALRIAGGDHAIVHAVLPRRTQFSRRSAGTREDEQVMAANVDVALIVCGLDGDFNLRRIERYLALICESGAVPVIALSKSDLCSDLDSQLNQARAIANGAPVVALSSMSGAGIAALMPYIAPRKTVVLVGSSGAGKSTLLNRLFGGERQRTAAVRESDSRGRHTTTERELVILPHGAILIDTPGMRELQLWAGAASIDATFDDIARLAAQCRFDDCAHRAEPDCAVRIALENGDLDPARWESYLKLQGEARHHERMAGTLAALAEKQRWKAIHKAQRAMYKSRGR